MNNSEEFIKKLETLKECYYFKNNEEHLFYFISKNK